jgi:hypothetical protein
LHGIYSLVTKRKYVLCYAYHDASDDPYDDMDRRANYTYGVGMNDDLLIYPTWQGDILLTLSSEALREGIEDSHLISTLLTLMFYAWESDNAELITEGRRTGATRLTSKLNYR